MEQKQLKLLSSIRSGQIVKLAKIIDTGKGLSSRLTAMGFLVNAEIKVVRNGHPGPFVICVKGSKIMLGRGMANKIMVL